MITARTHRFALLLPALLLVAACAGDDFTGPELESAPILGVTRPEVPEPVAHLVFDGDGYDVTGNGHDAQFSAYGTGFVDGCHDGALALDGAEGYARIPYDAQLEPQQFSVEVFFRHANDLTDGEGFVPLVVKMPDGGNFWNRVDGWDLWYQDSGAGGRLGFGIGTQDGRVRVSSSEFVHVPAHVAIHIVGTFDGQKLKLYINGHQVAATPYNGAVAYLQGPVWIGGNIYHSYYGYERNYFEGEIDEVAIYDQALSQWEIRERYREHIASTEDLGEREGEYVPHSD